MGRVALVVGERGRTERGGVEGGGGVAEGSGRSRATRRGWRAERRGQCSGGVGGVRDESRGEEGSSCVIKTTEE